MFILSSIFLKSAYSSSAYNENVNEESNKMNEMQPYAFGRWTVGDMGYIVQGTSTTRIVNKCFSSRGPLILRHSRHWKVVIRVGEVFNGEFVEFIVLRVEI